MSAIAAKVGGSKTTLWTYFPSKQELFAAVVDDLIGRYGIALEVPLDSGGDVAESLRGMGRALLRTLHAQPMIDLHRLCLGEAGRFPELAQTMYERGPARGKARLREFIGEAMRQGKLRRGDPADASLGFVGRLWAGSIQAHLLGLAGPPDQTLCEQEIEAAVSAFMRAWAPDQ